MFNPFNKYPFSTFEDINLDWLLRTVKEHATFFKETIPEIFKELEKLNFDVNAVEEWIKNFDIYLLEDALSRFFKVGIYPEITDSGYIAFNIPDGWDGVQFKTTGLDTEIEGYDYGHLVLEY